MPKKYEYLSKFNELLLLTILALGSNNLFAGNQPSRSRSKESRPPYRSRRTTPPQRNRPARHNVDAITPSTTAMHEPETSRPTTAIFEDIATPTPRMISPRIEHPTIITETLTIPRRDRRERRSQKSPRSIRDLVVD